MHRKSDKIIGVNVLAPGRPTWYTRVPLWIRDTSAPVGNKAHIQGQMRTGTVAGGRTPLDLDQRAPGIRSMEYAYIL